MGHSTLKYDSKMVLNLKSPGNASKTNNVRKPIIKYYLEEYFGIDVQMKFIDLEF
jgi:hypothetical protein